MNFELTEEQILIRETAKEFTNTHLLPGVIERDENQQFPKDQIKKLGELGFMGMMVDPKYGGGGMDTVSYVLAMEEFSKVDASTSVIVSVNNSLVCWGIETYGNDFQKEKYLRLLATGEKIGAFCLSEPEAGSDATSQRTTAIEKECGNDVFPTFQVYEGYFEQGGCFDNDSKGIPGRTGQEIRNAFPKAQPNWDLGKGWYEATYKDMPVEHRDLILPRVKRVVDDIWKNDVPRLKNGTLIVVVHGNFLDVMIKELLSSNNDLNFCAIHENTGISSFKLQHDAGKMKNKKRVYIEGINSYHHLLQDKLSKAVFLNEFSYEDCGMVDDAEGAT